MEPNLDFNEQPHYESADGGALTTTGTGAEYTVPNLAHNEQPHYEAAVGGAITTQSDYAALDTPRGAPVRRPKFSTFLSALPVTLLRRCLTQGSATAADLVVLFILFSAHQRLPPLLPLQLCPPQFIPNHSRSTGD